MRGGGLERSYADTRLVHDVGSGYDGDETNSLR